MIKVLNEVKGIKVIQVNDTFQLHNIEDDFTFACLDSLKEAYAALEKVTGVDIKENNKLKKELVKLENELKVNRDKMNNCNNSDLYMYNCIDIMEEISSIKEMIF